MADPNQAISPHGQLLSKATFASYKALADVQLALRSRFTLIVGRNASGKSSVLDGIDLASRLAVPRPGEGSHVYGRPGLVFRGVDDPDRLVTRGSDSALKIVLDLAGGQFGVRARSSATAEDTDRFRVYWLGQGAQLREALWPGNSRDFAAMTQQLAPLGSVVRLRLDARAARRSSVAPRGGESPRVERDGSGLPSVLAWLAGTQRKTLASIEAALAEVVPGAGTITTPNEDVESWFEEDVRIGDDFVRRRAKRIEVGSALNLEMFGGGSFPADLLSEGTVLVLALLTALHAPNCPRLVLLDDLDAALHPAAQSTLVSALRRVLTLKPDVQIVATTHSPYLLDSFEPEDVIVLRSDPEKGHARARSLADHPDALRMKGLLRTGELWSAIGDEWIYGDAEPRSAE